MSVPLFLDHLAHPRNAGRLDGFRPDVGTGAALGEVCRDRVSLQIRASGATISEVRFQAFGCAGIIATASFATEALRGAAFEGAKAMIGGPWARDLELPADKKHCAALVEEALGRAIEDLERKRCNVCPSS